MHLAAPSLPAIFLPSLHRLFTYCILEFSYPVFHLSDLSFVFFFFHLHPFLRCAFVPVHHAHSVSFFLGALSDPCYAGFSPEDSLIPHFPSQSTHISKRALRAVLQNRLARTGSQNSGFDPSKVASLSQLRKEVFLLSAVFSFL